MTSLKSFGPDGICSVVNSSTPSPPTPPIHCNTGVTQVCVDPINNHIIIYYIDGNIQDTGIVANCGTNCFTSCDPPSNSCFPDSVICKPKGPGSYLNGVQYTSEREMIFQYNDGTSCSLGEVCKCQTVIFSQNQVPVCDCPPAKCGDVFVNLETGDIYGFFGYAWDIIGNIKGPTGPTGPTGSLGTYTGTGIFGPGFVDDISYNQAINLLRQPGTYYPTFFGSGIATDVSRLPDVEAIVIGNHSDAIGPNNAANTVAIGYYAGQQSQEVGSVAIGYQAGYNSQGSDSVAIGNAAGLTSQGFDSIAIGYNSGGISQKHDSVAIGTDAGYTNQGENAVSLGYYSGYQNQGDNSISIGINSGSLDQGTNSIAIGNGAGQQTQGNNSIAIGLGAGNINQDANSIVICADGIGTASAGVNTCVVKPIRNVSNANYLLYDATSGEITYNPTMEPSSIRYKSNVIDIDSKFVDAIYKLRPVEFDFTEKNKHAIGFIAEEVVEHIPEVILYKELEPGKIEGIDYEKLVAPLVKIVQNYKEQFEILQERINTLEQLLKLS